ncbi:BON domain-containing protein [Actinoplanes sp. CA-054009]
MTGEQRRDGGGGLAAVSVIAAPTVVVMKPSCGRAAAATERRQGGASRRTAGGTTSMHPFTSPDDGGDNIDIAALIARLEADETLADRTARALSADPDVCGHYLEIVVQNGVVILQGELDSDDAREAARQRAWTVPGVYDVCQMITTPQCDPPDGGRRYGAETDVESSKGMDG